MTHIFTPSHKSIASKLSFGLLASALVIGVADSANAATFTFSFDNEDGPVAGSVIGSLELPDGDGTSAATSLTVESAPAVLGYTLPFDVATTFPNVLANSFTVLGGNIIDADFAARDIDSGIGLNFSAFGGASFLTVDGAGNPAIGVVDLDSSSLDFKKVPEPLTILGTGVALGFGTIMKKRKKQNA